MKKQVILLASVLTTLGANAQGKVDVYDFDNFKLHVYNSNDVMGDCSYIIEGKDGLVTMEEPLFKVGCAEFNSYLKTLDKKVEQRITDYHLGGTGNEPTVMAEGFGKFSAGPVYGGMMKGFQQSFGDKMVDLPTGEISEVNWGETKTFAGVTFTFNHAASSDFPAAGILIGGKVYLTHWAPVKMHPSALQFQNRTSVEAELKATEAELESGAELFVGSHLGAVEKDQIEFRISYLKKVQQLIRENKTAEEFAKALESAYPDLAGKDNIKALSENFYK